ncbi:MAG: hypothetical protein Athens071426_697 [Parcubacteria group bacterium Athens0714_26]|nr:MAG: hypothetical protein Athens101426_633 [Parcubacteria group bacterium Athens1014_26]TSD01235.1 MAG: hypothetical protein Athens071426_697 [Parcubacteria group bacterium Athens0714_26]
MIVWKKLGFTLAMAVCLILIFCFAAYAREAGDLLGSEITGLVIDRTQSRMGHLFYQSFSGQWDSSITEENIIIAEKIDSMGSSLTRVEVGGITVYKIRLKPRTKDIEDMASFAVTVVQDYVYRNQLELSEKEIKAEAQNNK